ncbi:transcriptional regulator [Bernardetia litoralis DSM 6794]|uniref:HTH-type transcriptional regulator SarZ n=1 Tax=Bernardetia litoralis (strain ATCC 23117 / DSM 6794 / NBRC 15988 / NCIMB 1366 / Fx l1 / Sio-4) TaxID=880071 RepID=I4AJY0_BERLS|nr:MarR family transcriptional regulator [Bernardetia litoralis]AFM04265.1 transcriptional regulator [Bernardetia litoralis DSM 6794]
MDDSQLKLSNQICFPLYSVSRLITKAYKPFLDKMEITYPQYLVLMVLWENDGITINQITEKLLLNTNTLSPLLKRMEKMEIIERNRSEKDERSVIITLTKKGENLKNQASCIPDDIAKVLMTENIQVADIMNLKNMLNEWIQLLSEKKD